MSASLNRFATTDRYGQGSAKGELLCPGTVRIRFQVSNAAIRYRVGQGSPPHYLEDEYELLPMMGGLDEVCDAVQVRSAIAGTPAVVSIKALTANEVGDG
jgi:hypothetical protein